MAKVELTTTPKPKKAVKPAPEAPAAPSTPPAPAPTPEELAERQNNVIAAMGWTGVTKPATPEEQPKAPETPPEPENALEPVVTPPAPTPEAKPEPKPDPAPAAPAPAPKPEPTTMATRDDIEAAANRAAQLVADQRPAPAPTPTPAAPPAPVLDLSPEDKKDYEIIAFLERTEPEKFKGRGQKFLDYTKELYAYQDAWAAKPENEGKDFDPDDAEHNQWFAKHEPGTAESDIEYGRERAMEERIYQNRVKPELDKIERDKAMKEAIPTITQNVGRRTVALIDAVNPELAKLVQDAEGRPMFTKEAIAAVEEADPIAKRTLDQIVRNELEPMVMALEMTTVPGLGFKLNPAGDPMHARIAEYVWQAENDMKKAPADVRIQGGKEFATITQYNAMSEADRERHYTLSVDDIQDLIVDDMAQKARKSIDEVDNLAKRKYKPDADKREVAPAPTPATTPTPAPRNNKPTPPSTNNSGDLARTSDQPAPAVKKYGETMASVMFK